MARNFKQWGDKLELIAPTGGVVAGTVYQIEQMVVVAQTTVAATLSFIGLRRGVIEGVPKVGSQAWAVGELVYWDDGNSRFTTAQATGLIIAGFAASVVASGAGDTTGDVLLDGTAHVDES